ncbi:MAG: hypothetical protein ACLSVD_11810 [Eggerthellaceae bacterium]
MGIELRQLPGGRRQGELGHPRGGGRQVVTVMADFTVFKSDADCIRFRSRVLLQNSRYADNAFIKEAIADHDSTRWPRA